MRTSPIAVALSSLVLSSIAWAQTSEVDVTAPESIVHTAPFDVAPGLARVHAGDRLIGEPDSQNGWLRLQLPDGRQGFMHAGDARLAAPPALPAPPAAPAPDSAAGVPAPPPTSAAPAAVAATASSSPAANGPVLLGLAFELLPAGTFTTNAQGKSVDVDTDATAALAPFLDVPVTPWLALGVSPQFIFNVKGRADTQSGTEYDIRARVTVRDPIGANGRLYARLSPGYSILSTPSGTLPANVSDPAGLAVDFSVGAETPIGAHATLVLDIGYQLGFQGTSVNGKDIESRTRFLHVGMGFALDL
jgi:hypothetical protein